MAKNLSWWDRIGMTPEEIAEYERKSKQDELRQLSQSAIEAAKNDIQGVNDARGMMSTFSQIKMPENVQTTPLPEQATGTSRPRYISDLQDTEQRQQDMGNIRSLAKMNFSDIASKNNLDKYAAQGDESAKNWLEQSRYDNPLTRQTITDYAENSGDNGGDAVGAFAGAGLGKEAVTLASALEKKTGAGTKVFDQQVALSNNPERIKANESDIQSLLDQNLISPELANQWRQRNTTQESFWVGKSITEFLTGGEESALKVLKTIPAKQKEEDALRQGKVETASAVTGAQEATKFGSDAGKSTIENQLADDFYKRSSGYNAVRDVYENVITAGENQSPTPQDDLFLIYNTVKMNDPNAVREGEIALVREARSIPQKLLLSWDKASKGTLLDPGERQAIRDLADRMYAKKAARQESVVNTFTARAKSRGADPIMVIEPVQWYGLDKRKYSSNIQPQPTTTPQPQQQSTGTGWSDEKERRYQELMRKKQSGQLR